MVAKARPRKVIRKKAAVPKRRVPRKKVRGQRKGARKVFSDDNANQLITNKVVGGPKGKHDLAAVWKVLNASKVNTTYAWAQVNRMGYASGTQNVPGAIPLGFNWQGATYGSMACSLPLALFSLSGAPNYNGTTQSNCYPMYVLNRNGVGGAMTFFNYSGAYTPVESNSSTAYTSAYPLGSDVLKAVNIKMLLYGTTTRATKFRIDLVQILEPYLHPDYIMNETNTSGLPALEGAATIAFYDELTREYTCYVPQFKCNERKDKVFKVMDSCLATEVNE